MNINDFDYDLPEHLIAQFPAKERSASRLLYLNGKTGAIEHKNFPDLTKLLAPGDLLVLNDTKVIPARLFGCKQTGGKIEVLVERVLSNKSVLAHIKASKAPKPGQKLILTAELSSQRKPGSSDHKHCVFLDPAVKPRDDMVGELSDGFEARVIDRKDDLFELEFLNCDNVWSILEEIGSIPLPPYIERAPQREDLERYQTVYAKNKGAVAAPTAGLHFDEKMLITLQEKGIDICYLTLHVGAGTFQPVRVQNIKEHKMHSEVAEVTLALCAKVKETKQRGGRVVAVGTTCVRSLESAARSGQLQPFAGDTDLFITPGFKFNCVDAIITNFHLPKSTLLMLVSAFAGYENIMHAYGEAVNQKYRFFSYGDAMFLE